MTYMQITSNAVAQQVAAYLHRQISLSQLVDWAEQQMIEGDFESAGVRDVVAQMGLADIRAFGLTWDDCDRLLRMLGFEATVQIEASAR